MNTALRLKQLLSDLIAFESVTPLDQGCQHYLKQRLTQLNFECTDLPCRSIDNFWAHYGKGSPILAFSGHTDVVVAGEGWHSPPFCLTKKSAYYFGRGVADMKGALASFLIACEDFIQTKPNFKGKIAWMITSAEESDQCQHGTPVILDWLLKNNLTPDYCLVGEPSAQKTVGDQIRIGRRGSLSATLKILGTQGHVAYPDLAENPIHRCNPFLTELLNRAWDEGDPNFPHTTLQVTRIDAGSSTASNVIPGDLLLQFNLRFCPASSETSLKNKIHQLLDKHDLRYDIQWHLSGNPFVTKSGYLLQSVLNSIEKVTQSSPIQSTGGGTSDGRYIASHDIEVIELGLCNECIHQVDENILAEDLYRLYEIYLELLKQIFNKN